jgi:hypothetical protein
VSTGGRSRIFPAKGVVGFNVGAWALVAFSLANIVACRHTEGAKPLYVPRTPFVLGTVPVTGSLIIDVGVSDVRVVMGEPQPVMVSNVGTRDLRDSIVYALETTPAECVRPDVSPGRIAERRRTKNCHARWTISIPRVADVRVRASVGDVELVAPADRAIRLQAEVGSVRLMLDGRELQRDKSPGSGDDWRVGDLKTLPRLDVRTGVGSIRADLKTTSPSG